MSLPPLLVGGANCAECGTDLPTAAELACPDCGKRHCGIGCLSSHTALGVCPNTQDEPLNLDAHGNEVQPATT